MIILSCPMFCVRYWKGNEGFNIYSPSIPNADAKWVINLGCISISVWKKSSWSKP